MRKVLAILTAAALFVLGVTGFASAAEPEKVVVVHVQTDSVTQSDLARVAFAIQMQISRDLYPAWKIVARIVFDGDPAANLETTYQVYVTTFPKFHRVYPEISWLDCFCYGFHSYELSTMQPKGFVFTDIADDLKGEHPWSVTMSHEILEMIVDPTLSNISIDREPIEVGDDVNTEKYMIADVNVSDFLYPSYFNRGNGPYDYLQKMTHYHISLGFQKLGRIMGGIFNGGTRLQSTTD